MRKILFIKKETEDLSRQAADFVAGSILNQLEKGKRVLFFVAGGSAIAVAVQVSELLREHPHQNLTITLTDERYGPVNHLDSNWRQLMEKGFELPQAKMLPVLQGDNLSAAAEKFNKILDKEFKEADYKIGLFGVGLDGHTAGILPNSPAVGSVDLVFGYETGKFKRITITPKAVEKLDEAVIFAQGKEKWPALENLKKDIDPVRGREGSQRPSASNGIDIDSEPAQILKKVPLLKVFTDYEKE